MTVDIPTVRLVTAQQRLARLGVRRRLSEAELFEAHGLPLAEALDRLRHVPRRRCPCAAHARQEAS